MKSQRNIARGLTLTLVGLMSWNTLPVHFPGRTVQAATRARVTEPTGPPVLRAVANGRIAFVSREGGARADIYTMEADGSNVQRLTNNPAYDEGPKWSPDGTRIAFASSRDDTSVRCASGGGCTEEIYVMNADGTNQTRNNNPGFDDSFDWSPDSTRIVFQSFHDDGGVISIGSISVMNADGSNVRRLTNYPGYDFSPKWSPDGTKIAFIRTEDYFGGPNNVSVMNADGTNQTRTNNPGFDDSFDWSPDGTKIAFVSSRDNNYEIYVMNADGSNVQRLTNNQTGDSNPRWSPDGTKIAFNSNRDGNNEIYVMNANGTNQTRLTDSPAGDYSPIFSPDSTKIAFNSNRDGNNEIYVMNADGSGLTNITNTSGKDEWSPSWQPISSSACTNPIDCADFFVRQHYLDFLSRDPDPEGLAFWTNEITSCGANARCIEVKRINDSGAFFLSIEFQETGYLAYRMYKAAYGDLPNAPVPIKLDEFLPDTQRIGQGVIVNQAGWGQVLENNKRNFVLEFVQRPRFTSAFPPTTSAEEFVDKLNQNAGNRLSQTERDLLVSDLSSGARSRADVLRAIAENRNLVQAEFNRAFVLIQYFGYLRRNPNDAPDGNFVGYNFWLDKLNSFNGDFTGAEMVKAFLASTEYRQRFGQP